MNQQNTPISTQRQCTPARYSLPQGRTAGRTGPMHRAIRPDWAIAWLSQQPDRYATWWGISMVNESMKPPSTVAWDQGVERWRDGQVLVSMKRTGVTPVHGPPNTPATLRINQLPHSFLYTLTSHHLHRHRYPAPIYGPFPIIQRKQTMAEPGQPGLTSAFAPPPPLWKHFTPDNLQQLEKIKKEASKGNDGKQQKRNWTPAELRALDLPPELRFLVPPEVPTQGSYSVFGELQNVSTQA